MESIPLPLVDRLSPDDGRTAESWWAGLGDADRGELGRLCDARQDAFFGPDPAAPAVVGGRFVPHDDARGLAEWGPDWFEYLLDHPEVRLDDEPPRRTFHICTRHPAARASLAAGCVPADFACPYADAACPMGRLLAVAPGHDLMLTAPRP